MPALTRGDFEFIAETLRRTRPNFGAEAGRDTANAQWRRTISEFARRLRETNPNFDEARFFVACGASETEAHS